jgi:hypothetical protein
MNRIITRGMGVAQLLICRGFSVKMVIRKVYKEVLRLLSTINRVMRLESLWKNPS